MVSHEQEAEALAALISPKMAKAMANTTRSRILMEVTQRPMSPSQFVERFGGDLTAVARGFRQLAKWDYIEIAEERRGGSRRGGVEKIYRGVRRAHIDTPTWTRLPKFLREEFSGSIVHSFWCRITAALKHGTFDSETNRHATWKASELDRQTFIELTEKLDEVFAWLEQAEVRAARQLREGEEAIPTTTGLFAFRSPSKERSMPPEGEVD